MSSLLPGRLVHVQLLGVAGHVDGGGQPRGLSSKAAYGMVVRPAIPIAPNPTAASTIGALTTCTVACRSNSTYCVIEVSG